MTRRGLEAAWSPAAKALILNTPWNPVGTVLTRDELAVDRRLLRAPQRGADQRRDLRGDHVRGPRARFAAGSRARVCASAAVLVNSLSKTYSMTGLARGILRRPGAADSGDASGAGAIEPRPRDVYSGRGRRGAGRSAGLRRGRCATEYARRRDAGASRARRNSAAFACCAPEGGFFAMADVRELGLPSDEIRKRLLHDHGVVVVHGAAYGRAAKALCASPSPAAARI